MYVHSMTCELVMTTGILHITSSEETIILVFPSCSQAGVFPYDVVHIPCLCSYMYVHVILKCKIIIFGI